MIKNFDLVEYKKKLVNNLSAWHPSLTVAVNPYPIHWRMDDGISISEGDEHVLEINIATSDIYAKPVEVFIQRNDESINNDDYSVWSDAYEIQEQYFRKAGIRIGSPVDPSVYWKLWDHLDNTK